MVSQKGKPFVIGGTSIRPGEPFMAGVLITLQEGWHTYWRDPGDSGMAPIVDWLLPDGFTVGPILWPEPQTLETPELTNNVYEGRVLLMARITPPAEPTEARAELECDVTWLICRERCVMRDAVLKLDLPILEKKPHYSPWRELFEETRARLPERTGRQPATE